MVGPGPELLHDPGGQAGRGVDQPVADASAAWSTARRVPRLVGAPASAAPPATPAPAGQVVQRGRIRRRDRGMSRGCPASRAASRWPSAGGDRWCPSPRPGRRSAGSRAGPSAWPRRPRSAGRPSRPGRLAAEAVAGQRRATTGRRPPGPRRAPAGSVSGPMTWLNSITEPGQPWVRTSGSAPAGRPDMQEVDVQAVDRVRNCGNALSRASRARQSYPSASTGTGPARRPAGHPATSRPPSPPPATGSAAAAPAGRPDPLGHIDAERDDLLAIRPSSSTPLTVHPVNSRPVPPGEFPPPRRYVPMSAPGSEPRADREPEGTVTTTASNLPARRRETALGARADVGSVADGRPGHPGRDDHADHHSPPARRVPGPARVDVNAYTLSFAVLLMTARRSATGSAGGGVRWPGSPCSP